MAKLTGKAKAAFLAKMARGRAAAARRRRAGTPRARNTAPKTRPATARPGRSSPGPKTRRTSRKSNPELLTIVNPARAGLSKAIKNYRKFHGCNPPAIWRLKKGGKGKPLVLIALGRAIEIVYEPTTGHRKRIQWFHEFGEDALLAVSEDRKQLFILSTAGEVLFDFSRGIIG